MEHSLFGQTVSSESGEVKYVLEKIRINGEIHDLVAHSDGDNVWVNYHGTDMTLSAALSSVYANVTNHPALAEIQSMLADAVESVRDGAPQGYQTLREVAAELQANDRDIAGLQTKDTAHETRMTAIENKNTDQDGRLTALESGKVDKAAGKGLSTEDFTTARKDKLDGMAAVSSADVANWNAKASTAVATQSAAGLMSAQDKAGLDALMSAETPTVSGLGAVPTSRTVNGKALSSDITLTASDVGAATVSKASFTTSGWSTSGTGKAITFAKSVHGRNSDSFTYILRHNVSGTLKDNTWAVRTAKVSYASEVVTLWAEEEFAGEIVFAG